jgi:two-component system LytT family response regulator
MSPAAGSGIRAVIADDEPLARDCVRVALEKELDVHVVAECADGYEAVEAIRALQPDLVFLDVQMPGLDGFGVIEHIGADAMPDVIFVTAFDEHALRAFEIHALDYVLKPFDDARFHEAVQHARRRLQLAREDEFSQRLRSLLQGTGRGARPAVPYANRLMVRERDRMRFLRVPEIDWIEAHGNYVRLYQGARSHLIRATLSGLLERLDPSVFVRIHRSIVVNLDRVAEVQPWTGGDFIAVLSDGKKLRVSRNYKDALLQSAL